MSLQTRLQTFLLDRPASRRSFLHCSSGRNTSDAGFPKRLFWFFVNGVVLKPLDLLRRLTVPSVHPVHALIATEYFRSAWESLRRFGSLKSLHIELPFSGPNQSLFRWKYHFGTRIESYIFLWPNSFHYKNEFNANGNEQEEIDFSLYMKRVCIGFDCLMDAVLRRELLLDCLLDFPMLENISYTDSGERGTVSLCGEKTAEFWKWLSSLSETERQKTLELWKRAVRVHRCYVPSLELPISGYVMKGITFIAVERDVLGDKNDGFLNTDEIAAEWDGFEDEKEYPYSEAVMEILTNHKGLMDRLI